MKKYTGIHSFIWLALILISGSKAHAQLPDYHLQIFDYNHGIRPGNMLGLVKDQKGFLWILYPRSVQRFDGREISTFKPQGTLENLVCDDLGRVWVTSPGSVYLFNEKSRQFDEVRIQTLDTGFIIGTVFSMPGHETWMITSDAFYEYNAPQHQFTRILEDLPLPSRYNTRSFGYYRHTLFINHRQWIYRYNSLSGQVDSLKVKSMRRLYPISEDSIMVSDWDMVTYWYDFSRQEVSKALLPVALQDAYSENLNIRSVIEVSPYRYLFASREGIFEYNNRSKSFSNIRLFHHGSPVVAKEYATSLLYDNDGYIWMSTIDGVSRFPLHGQNFGLLRIQKKTDDLPVGIDNIRNITEDNQGNLWFSTGNGFASWSKDRRTSKIFLPVEGSETSLAFPSVRGIGFDGKNIILGPSRYGIWIFDPVRETYKRPVYKDVRTKEASLGDFIDSFCKLRSGDFLVLGRDAMYVLNGKTYELSLLEVPGANDNTNFAFQGRRGEIWFTTMRGLHLLDSNLHYIQNVDLPMEEKFIIAGCILSDQRFLFSVENGIYAATFENGAVAITKYSSLFDDIFVSSLVEDYQGYIWATSEDGIYRFDPRSASLNLFDYSDNVQGYSFNFNSYHYAKDGVLYLGGTNGLNYLRPEKIKLADVSLNLYIEQATSSGYDSSNYSLDDVTAIPYGDRSVEIEIVCPYYNNPEKLKYRYWLEGLDVEWNFIGNNRHIRFTSMAPGEYHLFVEASINNVDWHPSKNSFAFRIRPPFWLSWWFIGLVATVASAALWGFIHNRNQRIEEQQEELEAEQAINYFSTRMVEHQSVDELLWDVARNCIGRLHFEDCVIYLLDDSRNVLVQCAAHGPKSPDLYKILSPLEIPVGHGISGTVALTGKSEIVEDTMHDPRYIVDDVRRFSEIAVPIVSQGRVLGVIDCEHSKKRFFTQRHLSILTTIASLCAARITKAKAEEEKSHTEQILMETKQQMADIEMQALRAQMNPHFIFNCLNSINRYIVKSDQATASLYLTRFAKLIRLILDNSNSKTVTLTNELEALRLYIEMESIRFEKQFSYKITVDDEVHPDHVYVPPLIIQPYVENAIWHGLLHKEEAGHLMIHMTRKTASLLECIVEDNGIGREKARELKSKSASNSKSLGMKLTENRIALLNKHAHWEASVDILDLKQDSGTPAGTRVIIKIPVDA